MRIKDMLSNIFDSGCQYQLKIKNSLFELNRFLCYLCSVATTQECYLSPLLEEALSLLRQWNDKDRFPGVLQYTQSHVFRKGVSGFLAHRGYQIVHV